MINHCPKDGLQASFGYKELTVTALPKGGGATYAHLNWPTFSDQI
jgi:hypothetical protein